jgi:transposase
MNSPYRTLKKIPELINSFRIDLDKNKDKYDSINLYFQDESRFGLMTKQKRVLVSKGVKPIGKFQHSYKYVWLWGSFSPLTGEAFYWETQNVTNNIFEEYLKELSAQNPRELKLVVIDNAGFHSCNYIDIPDNIRLIRIPPYAPELNPAEKVWQWMKDRVAMKFFPSIIELQDKITEMVNELTPELIKKITGYEIYTNCFCE